jgi:hypothetical protein
MVSAICYSSLHCDSKCVENAAFHWGIVSYRKIITGRFAHHIAAGLAHGRTGIDKTLCITGVNPELAIDLIALASELGVTAIVVTRGRGSCRAPCTT